MGLFVKLLEADPTGEVNAVCWKLLGMGGVVAGGAIAYLVKRLDKVSSEKDAEKDARLQDRRDFEAQTQVMMKNIFKLKSGGSINDS